jgi:hypothetical protein
MSDASLCLRSNNDTEPAKVVLGTLPQVHRKPSIKRKGLAGRVVRFLRRQIDREASDLPRFGGALKRNALYLLLEKRGIIDRRLVHRSQYHSGGDVVHVNPIRRQLQSQRARQVAQPARGRFSPLGPVGIFAYSYRSTYRFSRISNLDPVPIAELNER